ncbi:hypothetical protein [Streptomyces chrestomyceticus]|uniref:hypothetical protein n=1 Tax=Streptomyces chrestomyceticus TaxID=68185 RepID=UPI0033F03688
MSLFGGGQDHDAVVAAVRLAFEVEAAPGAGVVVVGGLGQGLAGGALVVVVLREVVGQDGHGLAVPFELQLVQAAALEVAFTLDDPDVGDGGLAAGDRYGVFQQGGVVVMDGVDVVGVHRDRDAEFL